MPEVQPSVDALGNVMSPPEPRAVLFWDGTYWRVATVDAAGHIQIDVVTSGLPAGAATAANQALILAQVQAIEDLTHALQTVATDRLIVRGEDQLFSFKGVLALFVGAVISGAEGYIGTFVVPDDEIWVVTTTQGWNNTTAVAAIRFENVHNAGRTPYHQEQKAFAISERSTWGGHTYLDPGDTVRVYFIGGLAGDACEMAVTGYIMTLET